MGVVLAFIIVSFAIWGVGDRFSNFNADELARVGSAKLTVQQYRDAYQQELQRIEQTQKRGITDEEAKRLGIDRRVLSQLLSDTILDQQAKKLGLAVGNPEIVKSVINDPSFRGPSGEFSQATFDALLRQNGYTEASYAKAQRGLMLRQDISSAVLGNLELPKIMVDAIHRFKSEVRDVRFFVLPPAAAGTVPPPTEAELKTYYDDHAARYVAPEYRKLVVLTLLPADLVKPDAVSDADVAKRFNEMKASRFVQPEKRTVQQLVFPNEAAAAAADRKIKGGESFDKVAADEGKKPADITLGTVAKSDLADPAVAAAAFSLPDNGTSGPVKGQFGSILVHVSKIYPGREQSLFEVGPELRDEIAIVRARERTTKLRDQIEDSRSGGKTLTEAAAAAGLKTRTIDAIDATGHDRNHKPVEGLAAGPQLLKAAFATDVGADTEVIPTSNGGDVWYEVAGIDPAHQLSLTEVKKQVADAWREEEIGRRLAAAGDKIVKAVNGGESLADAAAEAGKLPLQQASNIGRGGGPQLPPTIAASFFQTVVGKAGTVTYGPRGRIVFKVEAAHVPPPDPKDSDFTKLIDQVKTGFEDDVLAQYLARVQGEIGVRINQRALQTALGDSGS